MVDTMDHVGLVPVAEDWGMEPGYYVVGEFLGTKKADKFTRGDQTFDVPPKVGIRTAAGELAVSAASDKSAAELTSGVERGELIALRVRLRNGFGAQGPIKFSVDDGEASDWA